VVSREPNPQEAPVHRELTVAQIRSREGADHVQVLFLESARFYRLLREQPRFDELLERLREAELERRPVSVGLASLDSDVIEDVSSQRPTTTRGADG